MKERTAVKLSIEAPGKLTPKGRKAIAVWLRKHADDLVKGGGEYTVTGYFTARYIYLEE